MDSETECLQLGEELLLEIEELRVVKNCQLNIYNRSDKTGIF